MQKQEKTLMIYFAIHSSKQKILGINPLTLNLSNNHLYVKQKIINGFNCLSGVIQKMFWYLGITCLQTITNEE